MNKGRIEAFSDGVIAIIITIMVLELKVPHGHELADIQPLLPVFLSYILSFIYVGIYWNNHHHLFQAAKAVNGGILWANSHLLFWLSLIPFTTAWAGENHFTTWPVVFYGFNLFMCGVAYTILSNQLIQHHGRESDLARAVGKDGKGWLSICVYLTAIVIAFFNPMISTLIYGLVAGIWLIPDKRIERQIEKQLDVE